MTERVQVVKAGELRPAEGTPAMTRHVAIEARGLWAGTLKTQAGMESGWHHHGNHDSVIYLVGGHMRIDFGPGGRDSVEASAGDFISVPPGVIHREATQGGEVTAVVIRAGDGEVVVNVDGPETEESS
jgi:uncharacterized RmlC-like cupin family protein